MPEIGVIPVNKIVSVKNTDKNLILYHYMIAELKPPHKCYF